MKIPKNTKYYVLALLLLIVLTITVIKLPMFSKGGLNNLGSDENNNTTGSKQEDGKGKGKKMIKIEMENGGLIELELDSEHAPKTVENFTKLVNEGFYDGLIFHRVIKGFMIQGGCPDGTGTGGPGYSIKGEFKSNGVDNPKKHLRGVISMARSNSPDSAGSQFFIMHKDSPHLDGQYAAFGEVTKGLDVLDEIASSEVGPGDRPIKDIRIKKITTTN